MTDVSIMRKRKPRGWTAPETARLCRLVESGLTIYQIAPIIGVNPATIAGHMRKYGIVPKQRSLRLRFQAQYIPEPNSGCWLWLGATNQEGRARMMTPNGLKQASHVSLELAGRQLPPGLSALHTCDNVYCVNPAHLFFGTQFDNMRDCVRKGRWKQPDRWGNRLVQSR